MLIKDVDQSKNGKEVQKLESVEDILGHCNLVNNSYQQASKLLLTFVPVWLVNYYFTPFINSFKRY